MAVEDGGAGRDDDASATRPDVYLDDSLEAADEIARARELAARGDWHGAAETLQHVSDTLGDKLILVEPDRFVGIRGFVNDLLCDWPERGQAAYQSIYDAELSSALAAPFTDTGGHRGPPPLDRGTPPPLDRGGPPPLDRGAPPALDRGGLPPLDRGRPPHDRDLSRLLPLFERYFCTSDAAALADTIGQIALEAGDFPLARRVYLAVVERHPDGAAYAERYGAMLDVLAALQGRPDAAHATGTTKLRWMGQDLTVAEIEERVGAAGWGPDEAGADDDWPIFGGDATRNRRIDREIDELALIWRFEFAASSEMAGRGDGNDEPEAAVHPVVAGGLVLVQYGRVIFALDRETGERIWRYRADDHESGGAPGTSSAGWGWSAPTVHNGWVFAALPGRVTPYFGFEGPADATELVCLELATGAERWRISRATLGAQGEDISFDPALLARNDSLYAVGRRRRAFGFEDCYLYCFSLSDQQLRFRTHLGSASTGTFGARNATMAIPALRGDDVYVCTNLGTIADVSAHTGAVRWLRRYPRNRIEADRKRGRTLRDLPPWKHNPVLLDGDRVVALPMDALEVLVLDAHSGDVVHAVSVETLGAGALIGADAGSVYAFGESVTRFDLEAGAIGWREPLGADRAVGGRATWAGDHLLVPTRVGLLVYAMEDDARAGTPGPPGAGTPGPPGAETPGPLRMTLSWRTGGDVRAAGGAGNVLALADEILVAEPASVSAYQRKSAIWSRLRAAMEARPDDPTPALELARVALSSGDADEAMSALHAAVERAGAFRVPIEPRVRTALFETVDRFVSAMSAAETLTSARLDKLFEYASQCAPDEAGHLAYRLRFAPLFESRGQADRAVRLYQQILRDRTLRSLHAPELVGPEESPGALAESRITALIAKHGAEVYAPFEQEAGQWLAEARAKRDADRLDRLLDTFPNSRAARDALIVQADLLAEDGKHEAAARRLVLAHHRRDDRSEAPALIKRIADAYEKAGRTKHAYRWLTKAARDYPGALIDHDGARVTFAEYRARLDGVRETVEPSRPNVELPLVDEAVRTFGEGVALLIPRFDRDPRASWRRAYLYEDGGVRAMDPTLSTSLWERPAPVRVNPDLLFATDELAVFATMFEVFALSAKTGERLWTQGEYPASLEDAEADWEDSPALRWFAFGDDRLLTVRDDGVFSCISLSSGTALWTKPHRVAPAGPLAIEDAWVVYHTVEADGKRAAICLLSAEDGSWRGVVPTEEERAVQDLFVTLDGQVIMSTTESISAYDLDSRELRWKTRAAGRIRRDSVVVDLDAVYYSDDGHTVTCVSLEDGRDVRWESEPMTTGRRRGMSLDLVDGNVIASTRSSVFALDGRNGTTLWDGTTPTGARFVRRFISKAYVAAIHLPADERDEPGAAYFYDHRGASGVVPREGGVRALGPIFEDRADAILLLDGALLIQVGSNVHVWHH